MTAATLSSNVSCDRPPHARFLPPWMLVGVLMTVLFFQGCDSKGIELTAGPVTPFFAVIYDVDHPRQSQLIYVSAAGGLINLGALTYLLVVVPRRGARLQRTITSRRFQIALMIVAIQFNLILIAPNVWSYLVYSPITMLCGLVDRTIDFPPEWGRAVVAVIVRAYFAACWAGYYALNCATLALAERYLNFDRRRWWQISLSLILAVIFVLGTALGILVKLWNPMRESTGV